MNNETKMLDAVRAMIKALDKFELVLVEQIGTHTVVSTDFVLPEHWYVENCSEATEWTKENYALNHTSDFDKGKFIAKFSMGSKAYNTHKGALKDGCTQTSQAQFITHVYNPWKEEQSANNGTYFDRGTPFDEDKTQRVDLDVSNMVEQPKFKVGDMVELFDGDDWQKGLIVEALKGDSYTIQFSYYSRSALSSQLRLYTPPKFDPTTADKTKMYFAVHPVFREGIIKYNGFEWLFTNHSVSATTLVSYLNCTYIDHEPIQRRN